VVLVAASATLATGCSTLLSADPTPVPGAAATLTRSIRTPIPTPERPVAASPGPSPSPARVAASPGPSPVAGPQGVTQDDVAQLQRRLDQTVGNPNLPGLEALLLDHVSLSTAQGGSVMDSSHAAVWLRDRAGPGIKVSRVEQGTQTLMLHVVSEGWPNKDPIEQGRVSFSLRRYDASGRLDEENGDWKIDVIEAE
jgi:hypothetical protein